ncbi:MAG: TonB-dependent receptor, partial [Bacteroidales bacterium]|nr:TonB-dependent receptor [Bacteroidales bacterium]
KGYATGLDVKLSGEFIAGIESWISFSLMKTEEDIIGDFYYDDAGNRVEPGYIPRPSDQRFAVNLFFQDHIPFFTPIRVHINFVFSSGLPYGAPNAERYKQTLRTSWYRRVDMGFSYMFFEQNRDKMRHKSKFFRAINSAGIFFEVFNILGINNVSSYMWITDINNVMTAVPNYLTPRLINLKLAVEF